MSTLDKENKQFRNVLNLIRFTQQSIFLTGKAGTGKSTLLRYICENTNKEHIVLAPTGIAAINVGGSTLHSFFKLPFYPLVPDDPKFSNGKLRSFLKYNKEQCAILKKVELIIIDEISMVRADIIDFIDKILRVYSGNLRQPFGGKQMLLVGDVYQLEPVVTRDEREILRRFYETPHFFSAKVFGQIPLVSIELTKVYRQTDQVFLNVLDHIRTGNINRPDLQLLNTCLNQNIGSGGEMFITLAARRDTVDSINRNKLNGLPGESIFFKGEIKGDFPESSLPTHLELELKVGAQIIFIKNDKDKRWVNGTIGTISGIDIEGKYLYVVTDDGTELDVAREQWANVRYRYNETEKKIEEEELGTFVQFPVKLAWAITVHKSQGLTFKRVAIDFSGGFFSGGQAYVALSRCMSLNGLCLKSELTMSDIFVNPNIVQFAKRFNDQRAVEDALKQATADIEYSDAVSCFDAGDFEKFLSHFFKAIHSRYDIEKPLAQRYIRRKLESINTIKRKIEELEEENKSWKKRLDDKQEELAVYASEYYVLAKESLKAGDNRSALANFDKALKLNPKHVDAHVWKGRTFLDEGDIHNALAELNTALDISPIHFGALYSRAKARMSNGDIDGAASDLDRATGLKPKNIMAHELYGDVLSKAGKIDEAALQWAIAERLREEKSRSMDEQD